jgi:hypothetical protein
MTCRVEIVTKAPGAALPFMTGLAVAIQSARAVVTIADVSQSHVVVRPVSLQWELPSDETIAKLFPDEFVSCVRRDVEGETTLSCDRADERTMLSAAAAAAVLKRSWGWDESPTISVTFTFGRSLALNPVFDGTAWTVTGSFGV